MGLTDDCKKEYKTKNINSNVKKCAAENYVFNFDKWPDNSLHKANLGQFVDQVNSNGIKVILMIWPIPTIQYVHSLKKLTDFTKRHNIYAVELEAEDNWNMSYSKGELNDLN